MPNPTTTAIAAAAAALTCATPALAAPTAAAPACTLLTGNSGNLTTNAAPRLIASGPGPVDNLTVTPGDTSATITWDPPPNTGDLPITGYYLPLYTGAALTAEYSAPAAATSCTLTGLTNGTTYTVVVAARNVMGLGPASKTTFTPAPSTSTGPDPAATPAPPPAGGAPTAPAAAVGVPSAPAPVTKPPKPRVRLSAPRHKPGHRLTVRWHARHTDTVRLSWRRGGGATHTQDTTPSGRITLAGPPGTRYHVTATAGHDVAHKTYRIT